MAIRKFDRIFFSDAFAVSRPDSLFLLHMQTKLWIFRKCHCFTWIFCNWLYCHYAWRYYLVLFIFLCNILLKVAHIEREIKCTDLWKQLKLKNRKCVLGYASKIMDFLLSFFLELCFSYSDVCLDIQYNEILCNKFTAIIKWTLFIA